MCPTQCKVSLLIVSATVFHPAACIIMSPDTWCSCISHASMPIARLTAYRATLSICSSCVFVHARDLVKHVNAGNRLTFVTCSLVVMLTPLVTPRPLCVPVDHIFAIFFTIPYPCLSLWTVSLLCPPVSDTHPPVCLTSGASPGPLTSNGCLGVPDIRNLSVLPGCILSSQSLNVCSRIVSATLTSSSMPTIAVSSAKPTSPMTTLRISDAKLFPVSFVSRNLADFSILPSTLYCHFSPGVHFLFFASLALRFLKSSITASW